MTCLEKFYKEYECPYPNAIIIGNLCPFEYGYLPRPGCCDPDIGHHFDTCKSCWERDILEEEETMGTKILDSGDRTEFESGAVRDMREGKGRCDLLPLDVVGNFFVYLNKDADAASDTLRSISKFQEHGEVPYLYHALKVCNVYNGCFDMVLDVAIHFEEGAKKYGDNNWRKGIPVHCYVDSAVRHYLKYQRGDMDEPHDRAFCWNILCAIWTCDHHPELNGYLDKGDGDEDEDVVIDRLLARTNEIKTSMFQTSLSKEITDMMG